MSDYTWRLADIVAKPSPPRFKMSAAMYEPPLGNARGLRNQPHLFGLFGVKDFLEDFSFNISGPSTSLSSSRLVGNFAAMSIKMNVGKKFSRPTDYFWFDLS